MLLMHLRQLSIEYSVFFVYFVFVCDRAVDGILNTIDRALPDMSIKVWRPFASNAIVHVSMAEHYLQPI